MSIWEFENPLYTDEKIKEIWKAIQVLINNEIGLDEDMLVALADELEKRNLW